MSDAATTAAAAAAAAATAGTAVTIVVSFEELIVHHLPFLDSFMLMD